jgi:hypothetical protein
MSFAIGQAVNGPLLFAAVRVRTLVSHVGFVVDEVSLGRVSSWYFAFPFSAAHAEALRASLNKLRVLVCTVYVKKF